MLRPFNVPIVECNGTCFSLNVTSLHVKDREVLPFGTAYGCSQYVLSEEIEDLPGCTKKDILLRLVICTEPLFILCCGNSM
ncbi:hypothetical protein ANCCAN_25928 [Ancylostoma caninum]|uniref:Uncharacterized protein n=1 Tax=Ancylostoma caninum TaxID=29170 RepID=A0A368FBE5_ANCCA|nr:hypothetical protein ANCCAN_25928 [Ancylostoma caninum]